MTDRATAVAPVQSPPVALNGWCFSLAKRGLDLIVSVTAIVLTFPVMVLIYGAIKLSSKGPVLFRQTRVGKAGANFTFLKFRTMYHNRREAGSGLTQQNDARVTPVGRVLRKLKLDELPQLFHVLRGSMSLVGPRPDLPNYVAHLSSNYAVVLALTPGITSPTSLRFRHEDQLLAEVPATQIEQYYVERLLPQKLQLELDYARTATLWTDLAVLVRTAIAVFR